MRVVSKILAYLKRLLFKIYHVSGGMQNWYWTDILKNLAFNSNCDHIQKSIKPNRTTSYMSNLVIMLMIVRSCLIIIFIDRINRQQRLLLFTEQFPPLVRKHVEVLVLAWSIFYLLIMFALDMGRTTIKQWKFLVVLNIDSKNTRSLTRKEWFRFKTFRARLVQLVRVFISNLAMTSALILTVLSVCSGTLMLSPVITIAYLFYIIIWVSVASYPVYPLMSVLILWAKHHTMLQRAMQRWLLKIYRGNNLIEYFCQLIYHHFFNQKVIHLGPCNCINGLCITIVIISIFIILTMTTSVIISRSCCVCFGCC